MKSKSITLVLPLLLMAAVLFIWPGVGGAAMWIGLQGGANFVANGDVKGDFSVRIKDVTTQPAALGGVTVGYDFVKEGFLGYDWPNWLKYFSLALDYTYNNFSQGAQTVQARIPASLLPLRTTQFPLYISKVDGYIQALSLLFIAKYGFFPNPEFPFGRLIPYAAVGPGLFFSVAETTTSFSGYPSSDSVELGVVTEGGVRYMVRHNVSIDAAFRYRYVVPSYDVDYYSSIGQFHVVGRIVTQSFDAIFRLNYHF